MAQTAAGPDIFISYAREDQASAGRLAQWCVECGWSVFWDQDIAPGRPWDQAIEHALADARCVLVLWSKSSIGSDWVKAEAAEARRRDVLVPVLIENVTLPLEFRRVQTLDLTGEGPGGGGAALERLRSTLSEHTGRKAVAAAALPRPGRRPQRALAVAALAATGLLLGWVGTAAWQARDRPAAVAPPAAGLTAVVPMVVPTVVPGMAAPSPDRTAETPATVPSPSRPTPRASPSPSPSLAPSPSPPAAAPAPLSTTTATAAAQPGPAAAQPGPAPAGPAPPAEPALSGEDLARLADQQRQALIDKATRSVLNWPHMLDKEGGALMLEQAVLLGAEAVRRGGGAAADASLRQSLALMARPLRTLAHDDDVLATAFSPDGKMAASASRDGTAALWDVASGRRSATLAHQGTVGDVAFSRDGQLVATASDDNTARVWRVPDGQEVALLPHAKAVRQVLFGGDKTRLVTVSGTDSAFDVRVWSLPEGRQTLQLAPPTPMSSFMLSDDGRYLIGHGRHGTHAPALVWDLGSGLQVAALRAGKGDVGSAATQRDIVAVAAESEPTVSIYRLGSWAPVSEVRGMNAGSQLAFGQQAGPMLATGARAAWGQILAAPVAAGPIRAKALTSQRNGGYCCFAIGADGRHAAASSMDNMVTVVDLDSGQELLRARLAAQASRQTALAPDGRWLLTASGAGAQLWEVALSDPLRTACQRLKRDFARDEWQRWLGSEPWRRTCAP